MDFFLLLMDVTALSSVRDADTWHTHVVNWEIKLKREVFCYVATVALQRHGAGIITRSVKCTDLSEVQWESCNKGMLR